MNDDSRHTRLRIVDSVPFCQRHGDEECREDRQQVIGKTGRIRQHTHMGGDKIVDRS